MDRLTEALPTGELAVHVQDVGFSYGSISVLNGLSLQIPSGAVFGLLGANGAGKTTLIRLLVGLLKPQFGTVLVLNHRPSARLASHIGYMPQLPALYVELSVQHNVDFFARMYGLSARGERREAVQQAIQVVGLWERRKEPLLRLSGGMRQRVSLAIALVHRPPLLLLDEPTVGLDPELRASFWEHFRDLSGEGATLVISSHTMDDAAHCDELVFLRDGHVIAQGTPEDLRSATGRTDATLEDAFLHYVRRG